MAIALPRPVRVPHWRLALLALAAGIATWIVGFHGHSHGNLVVTAPNGSRFVANEWRLGTEPGEAVQVAAGEVTLALENTDTTIHEFKLVRTDGSGAALATVGGDVDLSAAGEVVASVDAFGPGETGTRTIELEPGSYVLFCDIPGHYSQGMYFALDVQ